MATTASTTTTTATDDRPTNALDTVPTTTTEKQPPASSADKKDVDSGETKSNSTTDPVTVTADSNNEDGGSVTDTQRKIRRAERFGMPVKLSEEEKRNSRAERILYVKLGFLVLIWLFDLCFTLGFTFVSVMSCADLLAPVSLCASFAE
ncbi:hypothetical protein HanPI659440_Chr14g0565171 [Helianthus annuus]|nr:hypothetical protein HanPI659440_Chr14g0565171 [Helianthus annuus]